MSSMSGTRRPIQGIEIGMAALIALDCLAVNAFAASELPQLSRESLGPFAVAYHDKQTSLAFVPVLLLLLFLVRGLSVVGRTAVLVFVGAAIANITSPLIWDAGVPDYIVFRDIDVIANLSDVLMISASVVIAASIGFDLVERARQGRGPSPRP